jgi:hypothetical protein
MIRRLIIVATLALGVASTARAQDQGPRLTGGGENAEVVYPEPSSNLVGGGVAHIAGGGDNLQITYGPRVRTETPNGLIAELSSGGEDAVVTYRQAVPSNTLLASRLRRPGG